MPSTTLKPMQFSKLNAFYIGGGIILGLGVVIIAAIIIYCIRRQKRSGYTPI
ncbi:hypothetical protein DPMN_042527 [Dreissena polymorpha]|uniref:Uncharacterized protein n=1 Tax=Dreissena polymorpha TaxID=45954 RepID=A0A9D4D155_DREPO|nr:hypothetical protein DPMN_042527 [Dreissena polymorpha]